MSQSLIKAVMAGAASALLPALAPAEAAAGAICPETDSVALIAGRNIDAGEVKVCNDAETLPVTYEPTAPLCVADTNLLVATSPDGFPQTRSGNPIPGKFDHGGPPDGDDCTATFEIPLDEIGTLGAEAGDTVLIVAHADLFVLEGDQEEGAWGAGMRFTKRGNWATCFTYTVEEIGTVRPFACQSEFIPGVFNGEFSYESDEDTDIIIPVGPDNRVVPGPADRGQPEIFEPGVTCNAFDVVIFAGEELTWELDGSTADLSSASQECAWPVLPTPLRLTFGDCDTGINLDTPLGRCGLDRMFEVSQGCADRAAGNDQQFVSCIAGAADEAVDSDRHSPEQADTWVSCAEQCRNPENSEGRGPIFSATDERTLNAA